MTSLMTGVLVAPNIWGYNLWSGAFTITKIWHDSSWSGRGTFLGYLTLRSYTNERDHLLVNWKGHRDLKLSLPVIVAS